MALSRMQHGTSGTEPPDCDRQLTIELSRSSIMATSGRRLRLQHSTEGMEPPDCDRLQAIELL
jgi:hypothetical protein